MGTIRTKNGIEITLNAHDDGEATLRIQHFTAQRATNVTTISRQDIGCLIADFALELTKHDRPADLRQDAVQDLPLPAGRA